MQFFVSFIDEEHDNASGNRFFREKRVQKQSARQHGQKYPNLVGCPFSILLLEKKDCPIRLCHKSSRATSSFVQRNAYFLSLMGRIRAIEMIATTAATDAMTNAGNIRLMSVAARFL